MTVRFESEGNANGEAGRGAVSAQEIQAALTPYFETVGVRSVRVPLVKGVFDVLEPHSGFRVILEVGPEYLSLLDDELVRKWEYEDRNLWVTPRHGASKEMLEVVREASVRGWPVLLGPDPWILKCEEELLYLALEHYMFTPELEVPIEPLHSLLRSLVQKLDNRDLWNIWTGPPLDHFFIGEQGRVSLCSQWIQEGRVYGDAEQTPSQWRTSAPYQRLVEKIENHPEQGTLCARCNHRRLCGGVLLAFREDASCGVWMEVFERISLAAQTLMQQMGRKRSSSKKRRGRKKAAPGQGSKPKVEPKSSE